MVYVIVVEPVVKPVTNPAEETDATAPFEVDHVPPVVAFANKVVEFTHTSVAPVIASIGGIGFTVTLLTAEPLHPFVEPVTV